MNFTTPEKIFNIGDIIFPVDFSGFHVPYDEVPGYSSINEYEEDEVKRMLSNGIGFEVVSEPYLTSCGWMQNEYFIKVKLQGDSKIYCILNSKCLVYDNAYKYNAYIDACAACEY